MTEQRQEELDVERMEDEGGPAGPTDDVGLNPEPAEETPAGPAVMVGPHLLGGIEVRLRDVDGAFHSARLDISEAAMINSHLTALLTMGFQSMYHQLARMQEESKIVVPGR